MYPIKYEVSRASGIVKFYYEDEELERFHLLGEQDGNVGQILDKIDYVNSIVHYTGYGTIENPLKSLVCIALANNPLFDGEIREPQYYLKDYIEKHLLENPIYTTIEMKFIDFSEHNNKPNIQKL